MSIKKAQWLWHPESPGIRVLVWRGFWGRLFKPRDFATYGETIFYLQYVGAFLTGREQ